MHLKRQLPKRKGRAKMNHLSKGCKLLTKSRFGFPILTIGAPMDVNPADDVHHFYVVPG